MNSPRRVRLRATLLEVVVALVTLGLGVLLGPTVDPDPGQPFGATKRATARAARTAAAPADRASFAGLHDVAESDCRSFTAVSVPARDLLCDWRVGIGAARRAANVGSFPC